MTQLPSAGPMAAASPYAAPAQADPTAPQPADNVALQRGQMYAQLLRDQRFNQDYEAARQRQEEAANTPQAPLGPIDWVGMNQVPNTLITGPEGYGWTGPQHHQFRQAIAEWMREQEAAEQRPPDAPYINWDWQPRGGWI